MGCGWVRAPPAPCWPPMVPTCQSFCSVSLLFAYQSIPFWVCQKKKFEVYPQPPVSCLTVFDQQLEVTSLRLFRDHFGYICIFSTSAWLTSWWSRASGTLTQLLCQPENMKPDTRALRSNNVSHKSFWTVTVNSSSGHASMSRTANTEK